MNKAVVSLARGCERARAGVHAGSARRLVVAILLPGLSLLLAACGSDSTGRQRELPANAATGSGVAAGAGGAGSSMFGNSTTTLPTPPMPTGGGASMTTGGSASVVSVREPVVIDACDAANAAGVDAAQLATLRAGGDAGGMRYLYPYDGTVFPRGMLAPEIMWEGADGSAVYIHIQSSLFDYQGCLPVTERTRRA